MTDRTWKDEFLPVPIQYLKEASDLEMLEHAFKKWSGVHKVNLEKHEITFEHINGYLFGSDCALCHKYTCTGCDDKNSARCAVRITCASCPLMTANGGFRCDTYSEQNEKSSPWHDGLLGDPLPMLTLICKAWEKELCKLNNKK